MSDGMVDPLRHNSWATRQLLAFCWDLTTEQLEASSEGTYGTILATLQHLVGAEGRYLARLAGREFGWSRNPEETTDLEELSGMAEDTAQLWEEFVAEEFDPERLVSWVSPDSGAHNEARAGILVAQTLNHGNEHRAQIYTILTKIGIEPPDLDAWSYAMATGRFKETSAPSEPTASV